MFRLVAVIWFLIYATPSYAVQQFLSAPFNQTGVNLQQGWIYMDGGNHGAIDYIKGTIDQSATWVSFNVVAAHPGTAVYHEGYNGGLGNHVSVTTTIGSEEVETVYAHLASSTLVAEQATTVSRGQLLGMTGTSGAANGVNHLHFVVKVEDVVVDAYGLSSNRTSYPENGGSCGANERWTLCPPKPYATTLHTQEPSAGITTNMFPGETRTFTVSFKNQGSTDWKNTGYPSNPDYVELVSCNSTGSQSNGWLYPGSGWQTASRVVTQNAANVGPGQNAWFVFTGKVPTSATVGTVHDEYFRPWHATGGYLSDWEQLHFRINVVSAPAPPPPPPPAQAFTLILRNPETAQWWARPSNGSAFVYPTGANWPPDLWLSGWAQDGGGYTFTPYAGDPNGDGYDDLIVRRSDANWYVAWNNQNGSFTAQGQAILSPWGTGDYPGKYFFWFRNMNTDQKSELLTYDASNANWYVSTFNTSSNTYDSYSLWTSWGGGVGVFQPLVGDWNGDGKTDVCLRNWSTGAHWVRLSSGTGFTQPNPDNWIVWGATGDPATFTPLAGDWNGDGKADIMLFNPSSGDWYVRTSSGSAFVYPSGSNNPADRWQAAWTGSGYLPFVGDFNNDGKADIGLRNPVLGDHWVRTSTGLAFTQPSPDNWQAGWGASTSFQLVTGRFGSGNPGGGYSMYEAPPDEGRGTAPGTLSFAVWTTPNPTRASTTLHFALPEPDRVRVTIHDIHGRSVMSVPDREYGPGAHELTWDRTDPRGGRVNSGLYFVKLTTQKHTATAKVVVVN